jgi:5-methylcytosine-specific restriction protein A
MPSRRETRPSGRDSDPRRTIPLQSHRWQKLRRWVLNRDPLCRDCGDVATDVDHDDGNPGNNSPENLVPRCHSCHSRKTVQERSAATGFDASGWPTSPRSHWNQRNGKIAGN